MALRAGSVAGSRHDRKRWPHAARCRRAHRAKSVIWCTGAARVSRNHGLMRASVLQVIGSVLRTAGVVMVFGWSAGCANDRLGQALAMWQDSSLEAVTAAWGQPDRCEQHAVTRICTWRLRPTVAEIGTMPGYGSGCRTMFEFDADQRVIGWRWRGDRCRRLTRTVAASGAGIRPDALAYASWRESEPGLVVARRSPPRD